MNLLNKNNLFKKSRESQLNIERGCSCMTKKKLTNAGFTLIELLIVIVIIGILAGIVIGVLNPVQQQNRARDASNRSAITKMALSTKSLFVSSPRSVGRSPTSAEFAAGVGNLGTNNCVSTATGSGATCNFVVNGLTLPQTCNGNFYTAGGSDPCEFVYSRSNNGFRLGVMGAAQPPVLFVYEYIENATNITEGFYTCEPPLDFYGVSATGDSFNVPSVSSVCTLLN